MVVDKYIKEVEKLKLIFSSIQRNRIIFDHHFYERAICRPSQTPKEEEIIENIVNPVRLKAAERQSPDKWRCYFDYGRMKAHIYILMVRDTSIKVKTVWILNRDWRREINARSNNYV